MTVELNKMQMTPNEGADFWYYEIGVNVISVDSRLKNEKDPEKKKKFCKVSWSKYETEELDEVTFKEWKKQGLFEHGIAIIGGHVWRGQFKGFYLCMVDLDNQRAIDELFPKGLSHIGHKTLVEQHQDRPDKAHVYFYTKEPAHKKSSSGNTDDESRPAIEVKGHGTHGIHIVTPSIHADGHPYEIVSIVRHPSWLDSVEKQVQTVCEKYGISYLDERIESAAKTDAAKYLEDDFKIGESEGRRPALLSVCNRWYWERQKKLDDPTIFNEVLELARKWNQQHCIVLLSDDQVEYQNECAFKYSKRIKENGTMFPLQKKGQDEIDVYDLAEILMQEYHFITLEKTNEILFYKNGVYKEGGEYIIQKRSRKLTKNVKINHIREIKAIIQDETGYASRDEFDVDECVVNLKNGFYNLKTGTFETHNPDYLSRVQIPIYYDENATCPRFDKFLKTSLDGDEEKIYTIWEMMAYCFIKDSTLLTKAFMHTGKGSNGKSILFGILEACLGRDNISAKTIHDFERNRFAAAALEGKLANICADVGSNGISETEMIKKIIAGDSIDCEKKYFDSYTFSPFATLIFSANEIPEIDDESNAFARRFELIEWNRAFYGKDRDHTVKSIRKDPSELSGIFNRIAVIAKELLQRQALKYETTIDDAKKKWKLKSDSANSFINDDIATGDDYQVERARTYSAYVKYCSGDGLRPISPQKFNDKMREKGFVDVSRRIGGETTRIWEGCILRADLKGKNGAVV